MTSATSSSSSASPHTRHLAGRRMSVRLTVALAALVTVLIGLPNGVAEPLQAMLAWTIVAMVAILTVIAIAKGLDLLLDGETS